MSDGDEDDGDIFDERGLLRDGARWRVPMRMMDAMQRAAAAGAALGPRDSPQFPRTARGPWITALDGGTAGLHRPGWRIETGGKRGDQLMRVGARRDRAILYAIYDAELECAWRGGVPLNEGRNDGLVEEQRRAAYEQYDDELCNAWRDP
jgi:hypothetical protein